MGSLTLKEKIKQWIASIGWQLFMWGNDITVEEYWNEIYEQENDQRKKLK